MKVVVYVNECDNSDNPSEVFFKRNLREIKRQLKKQWPEAFPIFLRNRGSSSIEVIHQFLNVPQGD